MEITKVQIFYCPECKKKFLDEKDLYQCPSCKSDLITFIPKDTVKVCLESIR